MNMLRKRFSAAVVCLLSFFSCVPQLFKRAMCVICVAAILFSVTLLSISAAVNTEPELHQTSLELTPNDSNPDVTITLNGMMPKNAAAEATDVTDNMESPADDSAVLAAYDISINSGAGDFQPAEGHPIHVEICDPAIYDSGSISIIHIADDGTTEPVERFTVEDGKVSFYATGFSIYEIVEITGGSATDLAQTVDDLTSERAQGSGFYPLPQHGSLRSPVVFSSFIPM